MTRIIALLAATALTTTAIAARPTCDDEALGAGLAQLEASNALQRSGLAATIVARACGANDLEAAIQATLDDDASQLIAFGEDQTRLWGRICTQIEPNQVTSELATSGCSVDHLGWSDAHFASSMTAPAMSEDATAAPFQFSPALASQQVARALAAQMLDRSRSSYKQAYLDAMAPVSTEERRQRATRTASEGLTAPSRRSQRAPIDFGGSQ